MKLVVALEALEGGVQRSRPLDGRSRSLGLGLRGSRLRTTGRDDPLQRIGQAASVLDEAQMAERGGVASGERLEFLGQLV